MDELHSGRRRARWFVSAVSLGALALATALLLLGSRLLLVRSFDGAKPESSYTFLDVPVLQKPTTVAAQDVKLADNAEVVGVSVAGHCRAYVLEALWPYEHHVINDILGNKPITISYCDMTGCLAVFTDPHMTQPLAIAVGGYVGWRDWQGFHGSMLLRVGSARYRQDNGQPIGKEAAAPLPYPTVSFERATWKQWRTAHPETDVYLGDVSSMDVEPSHEE